MSGKGKGIKSNTTARKAWDETMKQEVGVCLFILFLR